MSQEILQEPEDVEVPEPSWRSFNTLPRTNELEYLPNINSDTLTCLERLRIRLEFFFMDPMQKWKRRNTRPWKLLIQILKIVVFTSQLVVFGTDMSKFITYKDEMQVTFKQLFLKDWDPSADAIAYPGPYVPYAVYTKPDFIHAINYAIRIYSNVSETSVGSFGYQSNQSDTVSPINICMTDYEFADFEPTIFKYNYSIITHTECKAIENFAPAGNESWLDFDIRNHLDKQINFSTLISTSVILPLRTLLIENATSGEASIICFNIDIEIFFDNRHRDGQITINLISNPKRAECDGMLKESSNYLDLKRFLNVIVLFFCIASFTLCARSIWRACMLLKKTEKILKSYGRALDLEGRIDFIDPWLVIIIINDLMVASATIIISSYDDKLLETNNYTICSLLIGVGNFLSWSGLLRYLSFFEKYNLLIVTLRKSFANVLRFMLCTTLIYCGFCFSGWIIFGPYHFKFRQLSTTTECLFSLINGDDMFETFALLRSNVTSIWWLSRVYLYVFVSLFIYVVLSLFIALIMDAYKIIKKYNDDGFPKSPLQSFYLDGDITKLPMVRKSRAFGLHGNLMAKTLTLKSGLDFDQQFESNIYVRGFGGLNDLQEKVEKKKKKK